MALCLHSNCTLMWQQQSVPWDTVQAQQSTCLQELLLSSCLSSAEWDCVRAKVMKGNVRKMDDRPSTCAALPHLVSPFTPCLTREATALLLVRPQREAL